MRLALSALAVGALVLALTVSPQFRADVANSMIKVAMLLDPGTPPKPFIMIPPDKPAYPQVQYEVGVYK